LWPEISKQSFGDVSNRFFASRPERPLEASVRPLKLKVVLRDASARLLRITAEPGGFLEVAPYRFIVQNRVGVPADVDRQDAIPLFDGALAKNFGIRPKSVRFDLRRLGLTFRFGDLRLGIRPGGGDVRVSGKRGLLVGDLRIDLVQAPRRAGGCWRPNRPARHGGRRARSSATRP
jgi:hypothetical protein